MFPIIYFAVKTSSLHERIAFTIINKKAKINYSYLKNSIAVTFVQTVLLLSTMVGIWNVT